jgi:SNF2 family DNA or RNA helicase
MCVATADITADGHVVLKEPSPKLDAVMDIVEGTDQSVVVFTQFRGVVELLANRLRRARVPTSIIHGGVSPEDRALEVDRFQRKETRVFLSTVQTGGTGITLTAASIAVFVDKSWSPAANLQAEDRLHRFGQRNAVQIINIHAEDTVDQVVEETLEWKWNMIREILE